MHYSVSEPDFYPAADRFIEAFGEADLRRWLSNRVIGGARLPLSIRAPTTSTDYTPGPNGAAGHGVRKTPTHDAYLRKEIDLIAEVLPPRDRLFFEAESSLQTEKRSWRVGDVIGNGPGAFGQVGLLCYQNHPRVEAYRAAIDDRRLPVWRGLELTPDDLARRTVIESLLRHGRVAIESIEIAHMLDFRSYFAAELADLGRFEREGLVEMTPGWIEITALGRPRAEALCSVFDRYLRERRRGESVARIL